MGNMPDEFDPEYNVQFVGDLMSDGDISEVVDEFRPTNSFTTCCKGNWSSIRT